MLSRYMSKKYLAAVVLMILCLLSSCSSNSFKVSAELKGLGSQNVRVVYRNAEGGITDAWITAQKDKLEITGDCNSPSLLMVYNGMSVPILRLVVSGGDKLEVKGKITEQYNLEVKGSETMEQWNNFVVKHKSEYDSPSAVKLNTAIEKFVKDNPNSLVSTILVLIDFAPDDDDSRVAKLLNSIDENAKPQSLMESYDIIFLSAKKGDTSIITLNLLEMTSDDFEVAKFAGDKPSVIYFWDKDMETQKRDDAFEELKMLDLTRVNIVDINIDSDSAQWRNTIASTQTTWKHYWVPGSMMNSRLLRLQIKSTPTFIVTDSLGKQQYRGNNPIKARQTVESL